MNETRQTKRFARIPGRVNWLLGTLLLLFVVLAGQLIYVQILTGATGAQEAKDLRTKMETVPAMRGSIVDINELPLATNVNRYVVRVDPITARDWNSIDCTEETKDYCQQIDGKPVGADSIIGLSRLLAPVLGKSPQELAYLMDIAPETTDIRCSDPDFELAKNEEDLLIHYGGCHPEKSRSRIIAQDITPETKRIISDLHIGGVISMSMTPSRAYPQQNVAGSIVGIAQTDQEGVITAQAGLELLADEVLTGTHGQRQYEMGRKGERIPMTDYLETQAAINGRDVKSTIDVDVQWKLQQLLDSVVDSTHSVNGFGVVEKVKDGSVVAIAADHEPTAGSKDTVLGKPGVMGSAFEPGSTMKVLTVAGLLNEGKVTPEQKVHEVSPLSRWYGGEPIKDWTTNVKGEPTVAGVIGNSYNTGTVLMSEGWPLYNRYMNYWGFGIGHSSGSGFPTESAGTMRNWEPEPDCDGDWFCNGWDGRTSDTILFGQGLAVTPLQMVNAYATIGNGGINPIPTFISATRAPNSDWEPWVKPAEHQPYQVVSPEAAVQTLGIMESCVVYAVCKDAAIPDYRVGGKTGTAEEYPDKENNLPAGYTHSFIGVFPLDDPQYVVGFFIRDQSDQGTSQLTVPEFKELSQFIIQKYGVKQSPGPASYVYPAE
ncbi:cell division protein FtsI [Actinomycetota bacterium]|nr:cell division protein FtsI [Actinomycetota bacterium]